MSDVDYEEDQEQHDEPDPAAPSQDNSHESFGKENRAVSEARKQVKEPKQAAPPPKRKPVEKLKPVDQSDGARPWDFRPSQKKFFSVPEPNDRGPYTGRPSVQHRDLDPDLPPFRVDLRPPRKDRALWDADPPVRSTSPRRDASPSDKGRGPSPQRGGGGGGRSKSAPRGQEEADLAAARERKKKRKQEKAEKAASANKDYDPKNLKMADSSKIDEVFNQLDMNGNGYLSLAELDKGVVSIWPQFDNKPAIMRAYKAADASGDGWVTKKEFPFFLQYIVYHNNLFDLFSAIDDSDDRRVELEEFQAAAPQFDISADESEAVFNEIDTNGGGHILFDEFCAWMAANRPNFDVSLKADEIEAAKEKALERKKTKHVPDAEITEKAEIPTLIMPDPSKIGGVFNSLDMNGNGYLSLAELDKGVIELWPNFNNKPAIMRAYKATDKNGDGWVTKKEFPFFLQYIVYYNNLFALFDEIDGDDRRVTKDELVAHCEKLDMDEETAADTFGKIDANGGGYILFDEFCEWMTRNKPNFDQDAANGALGLNKSDNKKAPTKPNGKKGAGASPKGKALAASGNDKNKPAPKKAEPKKAAAKKPADSAPKQKAVISPLVMPPDGKIEDVFSSLDMNGNGYLSLAELDKGVVSIWPQFDNKPAIMRAYKAADASEDGWVTRKEFPFFLQYIVYFNNLFALFDEIDGDDRRVTKDELVAHRAKFSMEEDEAASAFDQMDANGGGFVLFDEFCEWMARYKPNVDTTSAVPGPEAKGGKKAPAKPAAKKAAAAAPAAKKAGAGKPSGKKGGAGDLGGAVGNDDDEAKAARKAAQEEEAAAAEDEKPEEEEAAAPPAEEEQAAAPEEEEAAAPAAEEGDENVKKCAQCNEPITEGRSFDIDDQSVHEGCLGAWQEANCPRCKQCNELCTDEYQEVAINGADPVPVHGECVEPYKARLAEEEEAAAAAQDEEKPQEEAEGEGAAENAEEAPAAEDEAPAAEEAEEAPAAAEEEGEEAAPEGDAAAEGGAATEGGDGGDNEEGAAEPPAEEAAAEGEEAPPEEEAAPADGEGN